MPRYPEGRLRGAVAGGIYRYAPPGVGEEQHADGSWWNAVPARRQRRIFSRRKWAARRLGSYPTLARASIARMARAEGLPLRVFNVCL